MTDGSIPAQVARKVRALVRHSETAFAMPETTEVSPARWIRAVSAATAALLSSIRRRAPIIAPSRRLASIEARSSERPVPSNSMNVALASGLSETRPPAEPRLTVSPALKLNPMKIGVGLAVQRMPH